MFRSICTAAAIIVLTTLAGCGMGDDTPPMPSSSFPPMPPTSTNRLAPADSSNPAATQPATPGGTGVEGTARTAGTPGTAPATSQPAATQPIDWNHFRKADVDQETKWLDEFWVQFKGHHFSEAKATFAKIQKLQKERPLSDVVRSNIDKAGNAILGVEATEGLMSGDEPSK